MNEYEPPSSAAILQKQDELPALRLLLAQRRLYTRAKRWQSIRWFGIMVLGIGAPFASLVFPPAAVIAGAVAGVWLFLGRNVLTWLESRDMTRAAAIQEQLDQHLFQMPASIRRAERPSPEDIADLVGDESRLAENIDRGKLRNWYSIDPSTPGAISVAISQRSNAAYTDRLIRTAVGVWATAGTVWIVTLLVWSSLTGVTLASFLLGIALPVLPAFMDVTEYVLSTWRAAQDRADLARSIDARIDAGTPLIEGQELLVWQERLFDLRRTTPQVPNWLYKMTRKRNERAMNAAARALRSGAPG